MIEINFNEYKETIADNMKLIQENHKLKEIIKEAIEYIEENKGTYESNEYCFDDMIDDVVPLLDILKGSEKE